jgi:hypothetical protein
MARGKAAVPTWDEMLGQLEKTFAGLGDSQMG